MLRRPELIESEPRAERVERLRRELAELEGEHPAAALPAPSVDGSGGDRARRADQVLPVTAAPPSRHHGYARGEASPPLCLCDICA